MKLKLLLKIILLIIHSKQEKFEHFLDKTQSPWQSSDKIAFFFTITANGETSKYIP